MRSTNAKLPGAWPNLSPRDVTSNGLVTFHRMRRDASFVPENVVRVSAAFSSLPLLRRAFDAASAREAEAAERTPFVWNPEFGYVTPVPNVLGTGLSICCRMHLEGLHLIGELQPALAGLDALRFAHDFLSGAGIREAAHLYLVHNVAMLGLSEEALFRRAQSILVALERQELNARVRLVTELPRVFEDAIERSLAILRSARLLSGWELLDVLSPLRIAASMGFLAGLTRDEAIEMTEALIDQPDCPPPDTPDDERERDRRDADLADRMNARFKGVHLTPRALSILS